MTCAVIQNNLVVNIIVADPTDIAPEGCTLVLIPDNVFVTIGFTYDGNNFIDFNGNPSVPMEILVEELPLEVTE